MSFAAHPVERQTNSNCELPTEHSSVAGRVDEIKEYTIATEVLKRSDDFNPKTDNIVRVQAHRLRNKLEEYYSREGIRDPVRIFIPSGHYYPEYDTKRSTQETAAVEPIPISDDVTETLPAEKPSPAAPGFSRKVSWPWLALSLLVVNFGLISYVLLRPVRKES